MHGGWHYHTERRLGSAVRLTALLAAAALGPPCALRAAPPGTPSGDGPEPPAQSEAPIDPLSVNATCYVCHMTFVREAVSRVHFQQRIPCIQCHGLSAAHANDEDIGATKPDVVYRRRQVDKMCGKCHREHDVPARDVVARFVTRKLREPAVVCTDCHGRHRIAPPGGDEP